MAGSIKGIIVEIGGDTSGLQNALTKVNKQSASLTKELNQVNRLLKFNPSNTELLSQKQKILKENIAATTENLNILKSIQEEYIAQGKKLDTENYRALTREIEKQTQKLSDLKNQASVLQKIGSELENLGSKFKANGQLIDELGSKLTTRLSAPITALIGAGVGYNAQIETYQKTLERFVGSSEKAASFIEEIKQNASKSPFDVKSLIQANQMLLAAGENAGASSKLINALGDSIAAAGGGNEELVRMASNLQQVKNARKSNRNGYKTVCIRRNRRIWNTSRLSRKDSRPG